MNDETTHATVFTRLALTPLSSAIRGLSTTARICSPMEVKRMRTASASTITAVATSTTSWSLSMFSDPQR